MHFAANFQRNLLGVKVQCVSDLGARKLFVDGLNFASNQFAIACMIIPENMQIFTNSIQICKLQVNNQHTHCKLTAKSSHIF